MKYLQTAVSILAIGLLITATLLVVGRRLGFTSPAQGQWPTIDYHPQAPDFPPDYTWFNTAAPLSFKHQLKGQVVLLDFWTYGCINCLHVIPDLDYLQRHFAGRPFVIIGVHSAKFANESSANNVRQATLRYGLEHPVVVDQNMHIWDTYGVGSWPTLVLVDASGRIVEKLSGEGHRADLKLAIAETLKQDQANGTLAAAPLNLPRASAMVTASGLLFPGKVLADPNGKRLFIADTGHNRIVICGWPNPQGQARLIAVIGSGAPGRRDGPAVKAQFNHPQGMAVQGDRLYVADTGNHLIRLINLGMRRVSTILGTGREVFDFSGGGAGQAQGINSPWDLAVRGNKLFIAMAGEHQIWTMNLRTGVARAFAGTGEEGLRDGPRQTAWLAQPSGLHLAGQRLYFADSENSAIRAINLRTGEVSTFVGHGLFNFGDRDGPEGKALLQHALGVAVYQDRLLVADTYNHKLREIDLKTGLVSTFIGTGKPGAGVPGGTLMLYEPGGLSVSGPNIFVPDTDNQRLIMINGATKAWHEVAIAGLAAPTLVAHESLASANRSDTVQAAMQTLAADGTLHLTIGLHLPADTHLTPGIPVTLRITAAGRIVAEQALDPQGRRQVTFPLPLSAPSPTKATGLWHIAVFYTYCTQGASSVCMPGQKEWDVPVQFANRGADRLELTN